MSQLDCYSFGRSLLDANDLDPVYQLLWDAKLPPVEQAHWLMAYFCTYHVGTASWIADGYESPHFYDRLMIVAASKEYPRSAERRHWRGDNALKSAQYIVDTSVGDLFAEFDRARYEGRVIDASDVMEIVQEWVGFGPWIAFKVADMLERLGIVRVRFSIDETMYESPTKAAEMLWSMEGEPHAGRNNVGEWAVNRILSELAGRAKYMAPPRFERPIGMQEAETILCKWRSHLKGKYHIGEDVQHCRTSLLQFSKCGMVQRLYKAGRVHLW